MSSEQVFGNLRLPRSHAGKPGNAARRGRDNSASLVRRFLPYYGPFPGLSQRVTAVARQSITARAREALAFARQLKDEGKTWLEVHNALYGLGGKCAVLFPTRADRTAFVQTAEHEQISQLLNQLPDPPARGVAQPLETASGNLHVRLPRSLHAALRAEAEAENISLNQLIVAKLSVQLRCLTAAESSSAAKNASA
jgi:predicted HicB family RNase H-like nuclease